MLASAGVASRRVSEDLIAEGRVEVDGVIVTEPGVRVDPARAVIRVDGISVQTDVTKQYYVFNKPRGVISTMVDPEGRPSIATYLKPGQEHLFHVGRLDNETEGLLILTNDGELANRLTHPSYEVPKTYVVQTRGPLAKGVSNRLREGVELEDGVAQVDSFKLVDSTPGRSVVELTLHSGRNRVVRRLLAEIGRCVARHRVPGHLRLGTNNACSLISCCGHNRGSPQKILRPAMAEYGPCGASPLLPIPLTERFGQSIFLPGGL